MSESPETVSAGHPRPGLTETSHDQRPPLMGDRSFWGMVVTQFLGAFNDNLFKQLMLLLALPLGAAAVAAAGAAAVGEGPAAAVPPTANTLDLQGWATLVFSLPFVLFSGFAGYLSDRFAKTPIIIYSKAAEIAIMLLGLLAFYFFDLLGNVGTWVVLFLMGTQSTFFGPGKYGILPELFRPKDLALANGIILATTFLAIIFGTVLAGALGAQYRDPPGIGPIQATLLWQPMLICVTIAVVGTLSAMLIRKTTPAQPQLKHDLDCWWIAKPIRSLLIRDKALLAALLVSCVFWLVSGIAMCAINRLGTSQLGKDLDATSLMTAGIAFGIMGGAPLSGFLAKRFSSSTLVTAGLWGMVASMIALGAWRGGGVHVIGYSGSIIALLVMGVFAAVYAIPLQVFLQQRPPDQLKGRMIATMNQANFVGILLSGPIYTVFEAIASRFNLPISVVFWMMSALIIPLALFYRLDTKTPPPDSTSA